MSFANAFRREFGTCIPTMLATHVPSTAPMTAAISTATNCSEAPGGGKFTSIVPTSTPITPITPPVTRPVKAPWTVSVFCR